MKTLNELKNKIQYDEIKEILNKINNLFELPVLINNDKLELYSGYKRLNCHTDTSYYFYIGNNLNQDYFIEYKFYFEKVSEYKYTLYFKPLTCYILNILNYLNETIDCKIVNIYSKEKTTLENNHITLQKEMSYVKFKEQFKYNNIIIDSTYKMRNLFNTGIYWEYV